MLEEEVYKKIMNQVIINKEQGYALYFKYNNRKNKWLRKRG